MEVNRVLIVLFLLSSYLGKAQTDSISTSTRYYNTFMSGALVGCGDCNRGKDFTLSFTTFHGIVWKSGVRLAVGGGLDVYNDWRMIPVLLGITYDMQKRTQGFYIHLNSGYSFAQYLQEEPGEFVEIKDEGGFTVNPMLGYRVGLDKIRIYIQGGYKYQKAFTGIYYDSFWGSPYSIERKYELQRFVIQMGFGLH